MFVKFSKSCSLRFISSVTLLISSLTSASKIFEYSFTVYYLTAADFPLKFRITSALEFSIAHFFYFFHYALNDFVFWLLYLFIDFCLVLVIRKNLKLKEKMRKKNSNLMRSSILNAMVVASTIVNRRRQNRKRKMKTIITKTK